MSDENEICSVANDCVSSALADGKSSLSTALSTEKLENEGKINEANCSEDLASSSSSSSIFEDFSFLSTKHSDASREVGGVVIIDKEYPIRLVDGIVLTEDDAIERLGVILHILPNEVIVQSDDKKALDLDGLICLEDRTVIGYIYDTFGPVVSPFYSVKIPVASQNQQQQSTLATENDQNLNVVENSNYESKNMGIEDKINDGVTPIPDEASSHARAASLHSRLRQGMPVFYSVKHSSILDAGQIYKKGYDASKINDEELPESELEFSDDEKEREAKKLRKKQQRAN